MNSLSIVNNTEDQRLINIQTIQKRIKQYTVECNNEEKNKKGHIRLLYEESKEITSDTGVLYDICVLYIYGCLSRRLQSYSIDDVFFFTDIYIELPDGYINIWKKKYTIVDDYLEMIPKRDCAGWILGLTENPRVDKYDSFSTKETDVCNLRRFLINFETYQTIPPKYIYLACIDDINKLIELSSKPTLSQLRQMSGSITRYNQQNNPQQNYGDVIRSGGMFDPRQRAPTRNEMGSQDSALSLSRTITIPRSVFVKGIEVDISNKDSTDNFVQAARYVFTKLQQSGVTGQTIENNYSRLMSN